MQRINVSTLGFELSREVPATNEEYNGLAPKRANPVLEDAVSNVLYRNTFASFRSTFLDKLEEVTGTKRINNGTEEEPQWESDGKFMKRLIALSGGSEVAFRSQHQTLAQSCMDAAPFDPSEREATGTGPAIGKNDLKLAAQVIADGKAEIVAQKLSEKLGVAVATDEKSLARAIADDRRARAALAAAEQKAALGM